MKDLMCVKRAQIEEEKQKIAAERLKLEAEKPEPVSSRSHYVPAKINQYIEQRAILQTEEKILAGAKVPVEFDGRAKKKSRPLIFCEEPGCCNPYDEKHHTKRFAQHHIHDPDQIYLICKEHHNLMHHGCIANEELGPKYWRIRKKVDRWDYKNYFDQRVQRFKQAAMVEF